MDKNITAAEYIEETLNRIFKRDLLVTCNHDMIAVLVKIQILLESEKNDTKLQ